MRYLKKLGLAAVAAMALTAFLGAGSASATVLCKTTLTSGCAAAGWDYGINTRIWAHSSTAIINGFWTDIDCTSSTIEADTTTTGSSTTTVSGHIDELTFSGCTCGDGTPAHVTLLNKGNIEVHYISGTHEGTLTVNNTVATFNCTGLGTQCIFGVGTTMRDVGKITHAGSSTYPVVHADVSLDQYDGYTDETWPICGFTADWEGTYTVTSPDPITVSES